MNARLGLVLCLLVAACGTTELQRKELAIRAALDAAFGACSAALNDPRMEWEPGARQYCMRIVNAPDCDWEPMPP